ncbi:hypothetical protein OG723_44415 (plasmid) [Streptomyces sp. NBC_01278]|uniref:hypothetical protein n=1 Tax=Streptomyces sp. NBC_01278 TaxID=2903809 RepID=UPI002E36E5A7|nr:hypothetical protein [Streptomyces sp. NBC_01278]
MPLSVLPTKNDHPLVAEFHAASFERWAVAAARDPFRTSALDLSHKQQIISAARTKLHAYFGEFVTSSSRDAPVIPGAGAQPGVRYVIEGDWHRGHIVGFWDPVADRALFQIRATRVQPPIAEALIRAAATVGAGVKPRPLFVPGKGPRWNVDEALYRPERAAAFRATSTGLHRNRPAFTVYTRLLTNGQLSSVMSYTAMAIKKHQLIRVLNS